MGDGALTLDRARDAFVRACRLDVEVPKPGNVSVSSPGHGMTAEQFIASADAAAEALFVRDVPVGARILEAVTRTRAVAGCNTNLGIVLLVAPLVVALEDMVSGVVAAAASAAESAVPSFAPAAPSVDTVASGTTFAARWRAATARLLERLDVNDAVAAYAAIALANPGGLGDAPEQPVQQTPTIDLRAAMTLAADRDSIARQYANGFADLFDTGLTAAREFAPHDPRHATLNVFLTFAGARPDSHIVRKHGAALAQSVTRAARGQHTQWRARLASGAFGAAAAGLAAWDAELKARRINPGTSADLTVATLFAALCIDSVATRSQGP